MVPPASVLTNKNCGGKLLFRVLTVAACFWIFGCSPPGPRALIEGKRLLDEGNYSEAVTSLEKAAGLLPKNAIAWNYLGLAYHAAHQPEQAAKAYRVALSLDHKLAAVRYNLGCLYLEQDNITNALEELRSFTLLQPGALDGWLKQGAALTRARRLDEAERSFKTALELQARNPEALNGLGLVQMQRRRYLEAINHFNAAATQEPPYAPAVLNAAIVHHQSNNRNAALNRYRQFLNLNDSAGDRVAIEAIVRQLETELNPQSLAARPPGAATIAPRATNAPATTAGSTSRTGVTIPPSLTPVAPRTNSAPPAGSSGVAVAVQSQSSPTGSTARVAIESPRTSVRSSPPKGAEVLTTKAPEPEVTQVPTDPIVRPAQELSRATPTPPPMPEILETQPGAKSGTNAARRGFFSRLNPFGGRNRTNATAEPAPSVIRTPAVVSGARYSYMSPAAPTPGDAAASEKAFTRGVKAQRAGSLSLAITEYQTAVKVDPANFDAYYNLGLASLERGDSRLSLWAYEIALALKPDNADARYNFALALKAGGYWSDSSEQFQKLVTENPSDARAHLSLANLFAQQLQQPSLAREHYQRVLEISPKHPEAAKIRFWLAANP
jgi:Flp pilus assembly protein TadD